MSRILIYRHPDCARCARIARVHHLFDLRGHVEDTTATPPTGPLRRGEIVVADRATGTIHAGAAAFDRICRAVPFYAPLRLLLRVPRFRARIERELSGCDDGSCGVAPPAAGDPSFRSAA